MKLQSVLLLLAISLAISCGDDSPTEPADLRGDVNSNGVPGEVGDVWGFQLFFRDGLSIFRLKDRRYIFEQSDINRDGFPLGLDDLVLLCRAFHGEPELLSSPPRDLDTVYTWFYLHADYFILGEDLKLGSFYLELDGDRFVRNLKEDLYFGAAERDGHYYHILSQETDGEFTAFGGTLVGMNSNKLHDIVKVAAATVEGRPVAFVKGYEAPPPWRENSELLNDQ